MTIRFHVDGIPKGQPRARAFAMRFGDKVTARMYDPGTAENWKSCIALAAQPLRPYSPIETPLCVRLAFYLPRPARLCRRKDPPGLLWHDGPGDADNFAKAVLDSLTQLGWWRDDRQVVELHVTKHYHAIGGRPGADIEIEPVGRDTASGDSLPPGTRSGSRSALAARHGTSSFTPAKEPASLFPGTEGHGLLGLPRRAADGKNAEDLGAPATPSRRRLGASPENAR